MLIAALASAASAAPMGGLCSSSDISRSQVCVCLGADEHDPLWLGELEAGEKFWGTCFDTTWVMSSSPYEHQSLRDSLEERAWQIARRNGFVIVEDHLVSQKEPEKLSWAEPIPVDEGVYEIVDQDQKLVAVVDAGPWQLVQAMELDVDKDEVMDVVVTTGDDQIWVAYGPIDVDEVLTPPDGIPEPKE